MKFFHFPGAVRQNERRQKWIKACHRGDPFVCKKDSYICCLHFVGGNGPTEEDPDPISAVAGKERVCYLFVLLHVCLSFKLIFYPALNISVMSAATES